jgi:hypothetical protein
MGNAFMALLRATRSLGMGAHNPVGLLQPGFGIFAGLRIAFDAASGGGKP